MEEETILLTSLQSVKLPDDWIKENEICNQHLQNISLEPRTAKSTKTELGNSKKSDKELRPISNSGEKKCFVCDLCSKIFKRNSLLRAHHREVHCATKSFVCSYCNYATNNKSNFDTHKRVKHSDVNDVGIKCDSCEQKYFRKEDLMRHKIKDHSAPKFQCESCDKSFMSKRYLQIHRPTHDECFKAEHQCEKCGVMFTNGGLLSSHLRRKHAYVKYSCEVCGKEFSSRTCLQDHLTYHSGIKLYSCTTCEKKFSTYKYLKIHSRIHSSEKPHKCQDCGKSFTQKTSLSVHQRRIHTHEKPYTCNVCLKGFVTRTLLNIHSKSHQTVISVVGNILS